ncbi:hypothetical protein THC_1318 [Caldimicrobium thiodismutans]|uniref:Uncharacterized protein n=1 Tax=Caldimicrobium thiodismutans TaxID=1653476 RepID=A0A0U4N308_9BACT|nr:hypothetical protein [Caldimicrobium thiodismutans]BAU23686.1 hypothetical protein THC_1318 [Caldimicrobium thiodismutans]
MSKPFKLGFIIGFILGIAVAFMLDFAFRDTLGGTWFDAVSQDLSRIMKKEISKDSPLVFIGVTSVIMFIGLIGGILGGIAAKIVFEFLNSLDS